MMKNKLSPAQFVIAYIITGFVTGLIMLWWNCLLCPRHLAYWQLVVLSFPLMWARHCFKVFSKVVAFLTIIAFAVQLCAWMAIIKVPLIH